MIFANHKNIKVLRISYKDMDTTKINHLLDYSLNDTTQIPIIYSNSQLYQHLL